MGEPSTPPPAPNAPDAPDASKAPKKILIVDDDRTTLLWLGEALLKKGYDIDVARNGLAALKSVKAKKPDLIVSDVVMPEMDGYQLFKALQKEKYPSHVLILTSRQLMQDAFVVAGGEHFMIKTSKPADVLAKIEELLALPKPTFFITDSSPSSTDAIPSSTRTSAKRPALAVEGKSFFSILAENQSLIGILVVVSILGSVAIWGISTLGSMAGGLSVKPRGGGAPELESSQLNGEIRETDESGNLRTLLFYDEGDLKWRKTYDKSGNLTSEETF